MGAGELILIEKDWLRRKSNQKFCMYHFYFLRLQSQEIAFRLCVARNETSVVNGVEDVEWSTLVGAVKRQYMLVQTNI